MITLKYQKTDSAIYTSHIDLLKQFVKIVNRAGVEVEYSKGFHSHMNVYFTSALPVGVSSEAEYVTVETNEKDLLSRLNEKSIGGLVFTKEYITKTNPKLTSQIYKSLYKVSVNLTDDEVAKLNDYFEKDEIIVTTEKKGEITKKKVNEQIFSYKVSNSEIELMLATGNPNLRIDALIRQINSDLGLKIMITKSKKLKQFVAINGTSYDVDEYLTKIGE